MKKLILLLGLGFALAFSGCQRKPQTHFAEILPPFASISPTVAKLLDANSTTQQETIQSICQIAANQGTPLVEPDPDYNDHVYITFLYRDTTHANKISFDIFGKYDEYRLGDFQLYRYRNTDWYYRSYTMPNDICFSYRYIVEDTTTGNRRLTVDPLNNNNIPTGEKHNYSWSVLDLSPPQQDLNATNPIATGSTLDTLQFYSQIMDNTRNIYIWLPPTYSQHSYPGYPAIWLFDSFIYMNRVEVPSILNNMIAQKEIEPMVAVFIDNPTRTSRKTELPLNPQFMAFMVNELLPYINQKYNISIQPTHNLIGGMSYGGLAAAYIAWHHPELFGKVLSQSSGFWRGPELADAFGNELYMDWLPRQILRYDVRPLAFYLDWGLQENMVLSSNRKLVEILQSKGYPLYFQEFNGWHDWSNSRKTFPLGLKYLLEQKVN